MTENEREYVATCPECGLPNVERKDGSWKPASEGPYCSPLRCSAWKVVGKSKNGGPLLRLLDANDGIAP